MPRNWYVYCDQVTDNFRIIDPAGFRVVAPDQRGYGETDAPDSIESYNILNLAGDIVGLVNSLGVTETVIVGHDWGAPVAWHCALLRPDLFRACALLSVPYVPRAQMRPSGMLWNALEGNNQWFYQHYFQEPGRAEGHFQADVRKTVKKILYGASGDAPPGDRFEHLFPRDKGPLDMIGEPEKLPTWLTKADVNFFVGEFSRTGFRGGLQLVSQYRA